MYTRFEALDVMQDAAHAIRHNNKMIPISSLMLGYNLPTSRASASWGKRLHKSGRADPSEIM